MQYLYPRFRTEFEYTQQPANLHLHALIASHHLAPFHAVSCGNLTARAHIGEPRRSHPAAAAARAPLFSWPDPQLDSVWSEQIRQ